MATVRLARLRSGVSQSPRASALPATVPKRPPSESDAAGPEPNRKRPPNRATSLPAASGAIVYGRASALSAPTRADRRGRSAVRPYYPLERNSKNAVLRIVALLLPGRPKGAEQCSTAGEGSP